MSYDVSVVSTDRGIAGLELIRDDVNGFVASGGNSEALKKNEEHIKVLLALDGTVSKQEVP